MRIAFLSVFYPYRGGIAQFNAHLYQALAAQHEVKAWNFRLSEKTGIKYVTLMFGSITEGELVAKITEINKIKGKSFFVIAIKKPPVWRF